MTKQTAVKVYLTPPSNMSKAMFRVETALASFAPSQHVRVVQTEEEAEIVVLHVIGFDGVYQKIQELQTSGKRFAIIQYCLRTANGAPTCDKWIGPWQAAEVVWSYYDLRALAAEDGVDFTGVNFYHAPLGCDPDKFKMDWDTPKKYLIGTSGYVAETESVNEANEAVHAIDIDNGVRQFHLGPVLDVKHPERVYFRTDLNDIEVSQMWSRCRYVAGLRRSEGFELPAVEGLFSGARPIVFDKPHYRQWYEGFAEFIPEGSSEEVRDALISLFKQEPRAVSQEERDRAVALFDWPTIAGGFFHTMLLKNKRSISNLPDVRLGEQKRTVLWIGDAGVSTGFARATHYICDVLADECNVHVLGLNYFGDPRPRDEKFTIWPCGTLYRNSDRAGISRISELVDKVRPDVIFVQNDPWNFPPYIQAAGNVPIIGAVAVDGLNCPGRSLNGIRAAIFWTEFGMEEARKGGFRGKACVIPLGVDTKIYYPEPKDVARELLPFTPQAKNVMRNAFIVGCVNRNQPRKRLDLTVSIFAEWVREKKVDDALLFLHVAPTADDAYDLIQLAQYYGLAKRIVLYEPEVGNGAPEDELRTIYNSFDIGFSTTQGEGMWLPGLEMMACGKTFVAPDWAALGDWARTGAALVECSEIACTLNRINVIGGIIDRHKAIETLHEVYSNREYRQNLEASAYSLATSEQYDWQNIGQLYLSVMDQSLHISNGVAK